MKYIKSSAKNNETILVKIAQNLHKLAYFSEFVSLLKEIIDKLINIPPIKLRHTRKKIMTIVKQNNETLLMDYAFLISKLAPNAQDISEIIAYLKLSSGKDLALSIKAVLAFSEDSLNEDDFQAL